MSEPTASLSPPASTGLPPTKIDSRTKILGDSLAKARAELNTAQRTNARQEATIADFQKRVGELLAHEKHYGKLYSKHEALKRKMERVLGLFDHNAHPIEMPAQRLVGDLTLGIERVFQIPRGLFLKVGLQRAKEAVALMHPCYKVSAARAFMNGDLTNGVPPAGGKRATTGKRHLDLILNALDMLESIRFMQYAPPHMIKAMKRAKEAG